jgi:hypothetical protein
MGWPESAGIGKKRYLSQWPPHRLLVTGRDDGADSMNDVYIETFSMIGKQMEI